MSRSQGRVGSMTPVLFKALYKYAAVIFIVTFGLDKIKITLLPTNSLCNLEKSLIAKIDKTFKKMILILFWLLMIMFQCNF